MTNKKALDFYQGAISENSARGDEKLSRQNDNTHLDAAFINNYCNHNTRLLDLGTGSGLTLDKISPDINLITAVEVMPELSALIKSRSNLQIVTENILQYRPDQNYNLVTVFGVANYFSVEEMIIIYKYIYDCLDVGGILIVKNQFGINEDVIVDGYSEAIKGNYYACYRHLPKEESLLLGIGFKRVIIHDIYPPEKNKWSNTNFYALVCHKE